MDSNFINHEESYLLNKLQDYPLTKGEGKFDNDGNPLHWPGCTIICPIQQISYPCINQNISDKIKQIISNKKNY